MAQKCSVLGCVANAKSESERTIIFSFPSDEKRRNAWLKHTQIDSSCLPGVCIKHFDESCLIRTDRIISYGKLKEFPRKIPRLAPDAIPTIFPYTPRKFSVIQCRPNDKLESDRTKTVFPYTQSQRLKFIKKLVCFADAEDNLWKVDLDDTASNKKNQQGHSQIHPNGILEVPGHYQKPHEIFISEKTDWSYENGAHEETDPLCIEEDQDCENTRGEEQSTIWMPVKTHLVIKDEPFELPDANLPPSELTVKQEKDTADLPPSDILCVSPVPYVKEIHHLTTVTSNNARNTPVSENASDIGSVKTDLLPPLLSRDGYGTSVGLGSVPRGVDCTAFSPANEADDDDDEGEVIANSVVFCSGHARVRIPYSQMITTAIVDSPNWRMSLSEIYRYVRKHFPSVWARKNWQNSVRHMLSMSPLFVKTQRTATRNAHYWSIVPSFMDILQEHFSRPNPRCCKWQLVNELQRLCARTLPREQPPPPHPQRVQGRLRKAPGRRKTNKSSSSTQKNDNRPPLSSSGDSRRVSIPPANARRKLERPKSSRSAVDVETDSGDESNHNPGVFLGPAPPLKELITRAIMLSPYRRVPLSVIYAYCTRHSPYYRNNRRQCHTIVKGILANEACFKRVPQEDKRPDYWTFDMQYKDLSDDDTCRLSDDLVDTASREPWEHDHGLYPKRLQCEPVEADRAHTPDSQLTDTASEPGSDTDEASSVAPWQRLRELSQNSPAEARQGGTSAANRNRSTMDDAGSECGYRPKRYRVCGPNLESLRSHNRLHLDYPFSGRPVDVRDVLDIKEEPFPEELPMENICTQEKEEKTKEKCTTLLNADCYGRVKVKQEKEDYPIAVKYEMVDTWC